MYDLSVIISHYNEGEYIEECLGSIYSNDTDLIFDVTIVDDCSTDGSAEKVQKMAEEFGIKFLQTEKNSKASAVRNLGIKNTDSRFVVCIDADDAIPKNYFKANYDTLRSLNKDVAYSNFQMFGLREKMYNWPPFSPVVLSQENFIHSAAMFRRVVWETVRGFDESMTEGWEDYDFWIRAYLKGFKFEKCDATFLYYRIKEENSLDQMSRNKLNKLKKFMKKKHPDFFVG